MGSFRLPPVPFILAEKSEGRSIETSGAFPPVLPKTFCLNLMYTFDSLKIFCSLFELFSIHSHNIYYGNVLFVFTVRAVCYEVTAWGQYVAKCGAVLLGVTMQLDPYFQYREVFSFSLLIW